MGLLATALTQLPRRRAAQTLEAVQPLAAADTPHLAPAAAAASLACGVQPTAPPRPPAYVCLANVRLPAVATDLLVTLNVPLAADGAPPPPAAAAAARELLLAVLRSLRVVDWGLFGADAAAAAAAAGA